MDLEYIVIEGNIGAGKTSLANKISKRFNSALISEQFSPNPFLEKFYSDPRRYAFPLEMSFLAERYTQLSRVFSSRDTCGSFFISDYFISKSLIFSKITLTGEESDLFERIYSITSRPLPRPSLYVYIHRSVENLLQNIRNRGRSYERSISVSYLEKIEKGYLEYLNCKEREKRMKILMVDLKDIDFIGDDTNFETLINVIFKRSHSFGLNSIVI